jgi:putative Mn2+ efflux pump MntP
MSPLALLFLAASLAMDAFAVAVATGAALQHPTRGHYARLCSAFGLFQALMPVAGWAGGSLARAFLAAYAPLLAFFLLAGIGLHMLWESQGHEADTTCTDPTQGMRLIALATATSIDALAAGVSLALLGAPILAPCVVIGVTAALFTAVGIFLGAQVGCRVPLGAWAERFGGSVLVLLGIKIWWMG